MQIYSRFVCGEIRYSLRGGDKKRGEKEEEKKESVDLTHVRGITFKYFEDSLSLSFWLRSSRKKKCSSLERGGGDGESMERGEERFLRGALFTIPPWLFLPVNEEDARGMEKIKKRGKRKEEAKEEEEEAKVEEDDDDAGKERGRRGTGYRSYWRLDENAKYNPQRQDAASLRSNVGKKQCSHHGSNPFARYPAILSSPQPTCVSLFSSPCAPPWLDASRILFVLVVVLTHTIPPRPSRYNARGRRREGREEIQPNTMICKELDELRNCSNTGEEEETRRAESLHG